MLMNVNCLIRCSKSGQLAGFPGSFGPLTSLFEKPTSLLTKKNLLPTCFVLAQMPVSSPTSGAVTPPAVVVSFSRLLITVLPQVVFF